MTVAVVTGAGRGIGRATATALARRGLDVALLARTVEELEETAASVVAEGRRALALRCDVTQSAELTRAAHEVEKELGVPTVVVANAGIVRRALVHEMHEGDWDEVLAVNLMLAAKRGRIVAIASISSTVGTARQSAYCAAKWGVVGFVKSLAEELRGTGLQAMSILPGSVETKMLEGSGYAPMMRPEDVANAVVYAGLDAPAAMNGSSVEMFGP
jgi:3-oxoacyl-[acyl-carrier protein] reductase